MFVCFRRWSICRPNLTSSLTTDTLACPSTRGLVTEAPWVMTPGPPCHTTPASTPSPSSSRRSSPCPRTTAGWPPTTPPCTTPCTSPPWRAPTWAWAPTRGPTHPHLSTPSSTRPMPGWTVSVTIWPIQWTIVNTRVMWTALPAPLSPDWVTLPSLTGSVPPNNTHLASRGSEQSRLYRMSSPADSEFSWETHKHPVHKAGTCIHPRSEKRWPIIWVGFTAP